MATLPVFNQQGSQVGEYTLDLDQLAPRISKQLLHDAVVMYQANQRQGTHRTKSRGEVAGTTKKMYRQKGTGNARAGSRRSGIRRGGGHIHAVRPRDYSYRLPKRALRTATRMALAAKVRDDQVIVLDSLSLAAPKTREVAALLKALGLSGCSALVSTDKPDVNVYKSARNIDRVSVTPVAEWNALALLRPDRVLVTRAALDAFVASSKASAADAEGRE